MIEQDKKNFSITSFLYSGNADYIEFLQSLYNEDPSSVSPEWREFFSQEFGQVVDQRYFSQKFLHPRQEDNLTEQTVVGAVALDQKEISHNVSSIALVEAYRRYGHRYTHLDPLKKNNVKNQTLSSDHGIEEARNIEASFTQDAFICQHSSTSSMIQSLQEIYCGTVGVEFMHLESFEERAWIQNIMESPDAEWAITADEKKIILQKLIEANGFEKFIDTKYKGAKRFGIDGAEALIPAIETILSYSTMFDVEEVVFGMSHRGRLNVLCQVIGKPHHAIFHEFNGGSPLPEHIQFSGDVKYHLGASCDREINGKKVHLSLVPNPSHLESVDPVAIGQTRAKQDRVFGLKKENRLEPLSKEARAKILPFLIHGDAAFIGQGVVPETLTLSGLAGYTVAGSLHFIVNNQIGFTTNPSLSRSSVYSSDIVKIIGAPVFHVNGDDVEAVCRVAKIATAFRMKFHKPVVIDMVCYRRFGHNEGDEPLFTQPIMYQCINKHKRLLKLYVEKLIAEGTIDADQYANMEKDWNEKLENAYALAKTWKPEEIDCFKRAWDGLDFKPEGDAEEVNTSVSLDVLKDIGEKLVQLPSGFQVHRTINRFLENRRQMIHSEKGFDWSMAEALAFGSLLVEGYPVRLSGQDSERGTFSQRHSVLYDQVNEDRYISLNHLSKDQAPYEVINAMLSEEAVLGFEYGYSTAAPYSLVLWEAQFGDFANGAQIYFDQYISSAEKKWLRASGLVCLLPHAHEGQGPEHTSARLERFLQLSAEDNWQVVYCTTPANYFHVLRRQVKQKFRKPLILMTPKSLLRNKHAVSSLHEMAGEHSFSSILEDDKKNDLVSDSQIRRLILCSGKVYYDLFEEREKRKINDVYLLRVEELYPFPAKAIQSQMSRFSNAEIIWCQEEHKNMGAWFFVAPRLESILESLNIRSSRVRYVGRSESASTAAGQMILHNKQTQVLLEEVFGNLEKSGV